MIDLKKYPKINNVKKTLEKLISNDCKFFDEFPNTVAYLLLENFDELNQTLQYSNLKIYEDCVNKEIHISYLDEKNYQCDYFFLNEELNGEEILFVRNNYSTVLDRGVPGLFYMCDPRTENLLSQHYKL